MANQMASNPWIIDTLPATPAAGMVHAMQFEYIRYNAATDSVEVQDANGRVIAFIKGALDGTTVRSAWRGWVQGVTVPVTDSAGNPNMPSGKLLIYFE